VRVISPPESDWDDLPDALQDGEKETLRLLASKLPVDWDIYVQPHMNGLRPDIVLLSRDRGLRVLEIKDYEESTLSPRKLEEAIDQARLYRDAVKNLYCPRLRTESGLAAYTQVVLAKVERHALLDYVTPDWSPIHIVVAGDPESLLKPRGFEEVNISPDLYDDLRHYLVEPEVSVEQRRPLRAELERDQVYLMESRTPTGFRRIRGPAGSGKSLVLAGRAAELAKDGKDVLVVYFNITLGHYLQDLAVRTQAGTSRSAGIRRGITWLHFHAWCRRVCYQGGMRRAYKRLPWFERDATNEVLSSLLPALASDAVELGHTDTYDAILVDEAQDFRLEWWNALRGVLRPGGEMVLAADATQDLYGTARAWTEDSLLGAGFRGGRWAELKTSHRLPGEVVTKASEFARRFLMDRAGNEVDPFVLLPQEDQTSLDLYPCALRWRDIATREEPAPVCVEEVLGLLETCRDLAIPDLTFLAPSNRIGFEVTSALRERGIVVSETFGRGGHGSPSSKYAFRKGRAAVKATTIHSFKGWEARAVVILVPSGPGTDALAAIYAAMTRVRKNTAGSLLTVVNSRDDLREYGRSWSEAGIVDSA
jgi:hypothetical protein